MSKERDVGLALSVLERVRKFDRHASISGGFPRDLYFGKQYSDVDVYLRGVNGFNTVDYEHLVKNMFPELEEYEQSGSMSHFEESGISWMYNTCRFKIDGLEFNFVFIKDNPMSAVSSFDFDLCQFYLGSDGVPVRCSYSDFSDKKAKALTGNMNKKQLEFCILHHYPKLKKKYPDFDFGEVEILHRAKTTKLGSML
jgi:hypothetical protein